MVEGAGATADSVNPTNSACAPRGGQHVAKPDDRGADLKTCDLGPDRLDGSGDVPAEVVLCPGHQLLAVLSDKWVTLVVSALADGPLRYNQLSRIVAGTSQKMLTQTVRRLEREGIVR